MQSNRDRDILGHILRYCEQIETAHQDFGRSKDRFAQSSTYQNAVCMCILQIGELTGKLSDVFRLEHAAIPWQKIRGMRNFVAHEYGRLDLDVVWFTATQSISQLRRFCESMLDAKEQP